MFEFTILHGLLLVQFLLNDYIKYSNAFYKDHERMEVKITGMGNAELVMSFRRGSFSRSYYQVCDEGYMWPYYKCDVYILYTGLVSGALINNDWYRFWIEILEKNILGKWINNDIRNEYLKSLILLSITDSLYFENNDYPTAYVPNYFTCNIYFQVAGICASIRDLDVSGYETLIDQCRFIYIQQIGVLMHLHMSSGVSDAVFSYQISCQKYYFKSSCWRYCKPLSGRHACDEDGNEICLGDYESLPVFYSYHKITNLYVTWTEELQKLENCLFVNHCHTMINAEGKIRCKTHLGYLCYPLSNASYTCLVFSPIYIMSKYSEIINSSFVSVLNGEYISANFYFDGSRNNIIKNNSYCNWGFTDNHYYTDYEAIDIFTKPNIVRFMTYILHGNYGLKLTCFIGRYRTFVFTRRFIAYVLPKKIHIENISFSKRNLYIGQKIKCLSNADPQNVTTHLLQLLSGNFPVPNRRFIHILDIPLSAEIGIFTLECLFSFIFPDERPKYEVPATFYYELRSYVKFGWLFPYKNVYTHNEYAGCVYLSYFEGGLSIKILVGRGEINAFPPSYFQTVSTISGEYRLLCSLMSFHSEMNVYFKPYYFEIHSLPSELCLLPFFAVLGAIIRCGHNGYPPDQAEFHFNLFNDKNEIISTLSRSEASNYVKIPYRLKEKVLYAICNVTFLFYSNFTIFDMKQKVRLSNATKSHSGYTDKEYMCSLHIDEPIENAIQLSESVLYFTAEIFILECHSTFLKTPWYGLSCALPFCTVIFIILINLSVVSFKFKRNRSNIIRRYINDRLLELTSMAVRGELNDFQVFIGKVSSIKTRISTEQTFESSYPIK